MALMLYNNKRSTNREGEKNSICDFYHFRNLLHCIMHTFGTHWRVLKAASLHVAQRRLKYLKIIACRH